MRRATLRGYTTYTHPDTEFVHRACNADAETDLEHTERTRRFERTRAYYESKWGGARDAETFGYPFDDPAYDLTIDAAHADNPYPPYERKDIPSDIRG